MIDIIIFQTVVFTAFVTFILIWNKGPLPSFSDSWYELEEKRGGMWPLLFVATLWAVGLPMIYLDSEWLEYGGVCLMLVGTAAMFKLKGAERFHIAGAWGSIGFSLYDLVEKGNFYPLIIVGVFSTLALIFKINNKTWWIEIISFYVIEWGLYNEFR